MNVARNNTPAISNNIGITFHYGNIHKKGEPKLPFYLGAVPGEFDNVAYHTENCYVLGVILSLHDGAFCRILREEVANVVDYAIVTISDNFEVSLQTTFPFAEETSPILNMGELRQLTFTTALWALHEYSFHLNTLLIMD
jgi:hypothetical protein